MEDPTDADILDITEDAIDDMIGEMMLMSRMPKQKPGRSVQWYRTPPELLTALQRRLSIVGFSIDLAADASNSVCPQFYSEADDALTQSWYRGPGWAFCNPPYAHIEPWVKKAHEEMELHGAHVAMLVPASTGSNWWADYVDEVAHVLLLNGRVTFVGETSPFPKDSAVLLYLPCVRGGYEVWPWREDPHV
mgnify:CR=1 FL=1